MINNGSICTVITYSLSRIGRNLLNILKFVDDCGFKTGKARLICVADGIDTNNGGPMANMLMQFLGIIAEMELQHITERNRSVKMYLKGSNRYCGGNVGKFLKVEIRDGKKYVDFDNKELLNRIVEMRSTMTLKEISEKLKGEGIVNSRGTHYSVASICQIIKRYGHGDGNRIAA
jgi:DNA invertase Pin-like site-specific DNA recombinase